MLNPPIAVPSGYRSNLDQHGFRRDRNERPELCRGTVEFVAGPDFLSRPIQVRQYVLLLRLRSLCVDRQPGSVLLVHH